MLIDKNILINNNIYKVSNLLVKMLKGLVNLLDSISNGSEALSWNVKLCSASRNLARINEMWRQGYEISRQDRKAYYISKAFFIDPSPRDRSYDSKFLQDKSFNAITEGLQYFSH